MTCEELNAAWTLKHAIEREQRRLKDLEVMAEATTPILDGMPHSKPLVYKTERIAIKLTECKSLIEELTAQMVETKFALLTKLQSYHLNEFVERVLSYHYVSCLTFGKIAKLIGFTTDYVRKLHVKGLKKLGLDIDAMNNVKNFRVQSCSVVSSRVQSCSVAVDSCQGI